MDIFNVPVFKTGGGLRKDGDEIDLYAEIQFNKTVCLVHSHRKNLSLAIGTAQLRKDGDTVYADLYIVKNEDWNERLTPSVGSKVLKSVTNLKTGVRTITEMQINVVSLDIGPNIDPRIKTLGEL